jgi:hypothetical protein
LGKIIHPDFASEGFHLVVDFFLLVHFGQCIQSLFIFSGFKNSNLLLQKLPDRTETGRFFPRVLKTKKKANLLFHNIRQRMWARQCLAFLTSPCHWFIEQVTGSHQFQ